MTAGLLSYRKLSTRNYRYPLTPAPVITYATWNPSDKAGTITLSGGNLITSGSKGVRSTISKNGTGKWYWEVTISNSTSGQVGIANSSYTLTNYLGQDANGWAYGASGTIDNNGAALQTGLATYTTGDIIGVAFDSVAGTLQFYKNNVSQGSAVTGLSGALFAAVGGNLATNMTANFGASALTYTPPGGYNAGLYT